MIGKVLILTVPCSFPVRCLLKPGGGGTEPGTVNRCYGSISRGRNRYYGSISRGRNRTLLSRCRENIYAELAHVVLCIYYILVHIIMNSKTDREFRRGRDCLLDPLMA